MAIDYGDKRVGIAISDELCSIAQGHSVIDAENENFLIESILKLIREYDIGRIVIGLPRNMDGSCGFQSQKVLKFKDSIAAQIEIPVELLDERLTTIQARKISIQQGVKKRKRKSLMDVISAALILENYLSIFENKNNSL